MADHPCGLSFRFFGFTILFHSYCLQVMAAVERLMDGPVVRNAYILPGRLFTKTVDFAKRHPEESVVSVRADASCIPAIARIAKQVGATRKGCFHELKIL